MSVGEARMPASGQTPVPVVDVEAMDRNIAAMAATARRQGLALRPHAKTHKCVEIARRQVAAGAVGLTVATVGEAEVFVDAGVTDDVFIAYPLWVVGERARRLRALSERAAIRVAVDSAPGARQLAAAVAGATEVLVEIDSGHHRTGVNPGQAGEIARAASDAGLEVAGVFTFPGHGYAPTRPSQAAADEAAALQEAASSLTQAGIRPRVLSGGSTPTAGYTRDGLTELRPGVYVFGDAQQLELGTITTDEVALWVEATVVSARPGTIVLDAGSKVLGADQPAWISGGGRLLDRPGARITALSEHHATVTLGLEQPSPELGDTIRVIPNHVCTAVNLADQLHAVHSGGNYERWTVAARGANR
ncbi:alanine racemase [Actinomycetospora soli]|uniref:alanine racemase n=1 Tax=Actinomycetospora soli TaxID=2893887 RepID=UPI001E5C7169|nr:alanine racemase [Actinomycetospora soli]MCD2191621.1 alanine racemase [Actinomycetospora soli]